MDASFFFSIDMKIVVKMYGLSYHCNMPPTANLDGSILMEGFVFDIPTVLLEADCRYVVSKLVEKIQFASIFFLRVH